MRKSKHLAEQKALEIRLVADIRNLITEARHHTTVAVNAGLTALYWRIGGRIQREVLGSQRGAYGERIVATLSRQLMAEYGRGYAEKNLWRMVQFGGTSRARMRGG